MPSFLLVRATAPGDIGGLDEEALLDLHARVRRVRNKHVGVYRRQAASRVSARHRVVRPDAVTNTTPRGWRSSRTPWRG